MRGPSGGSPERQPAAAPRHETVPRGSCSKSLSLSHEEEAKKEEAKKEEAKKEEAKKGEALAPHPRDDTPLHRDNDRGAARRLNCAPRSLARRRTRGAGARGAQRRVLPRHRLQGTSLVGQASEREVSRRARRGTQAAGFAPSPSRLRRGAPDARAITTLPSRQPGYAQRRGADLTDRCAITTLPSRDPAIATPRGYAHDHRRVRPSSRRGAPDACATTPDARAITGGPDQVQDVRARVRARARAQAARRRELEPPRQQRHAQPALAQTARRQAARQGNDTPDETPCPPLPPLSRRTCGDGLASRVVARGVITGGVSR